MLIPQFHPVANCAVDRTPNGMTLLSQNLIDRFFKPICSSTNCWEY